MATITNPLDQLTYKGTKFHWDSVHQQAFDQIKNILKKDESLGFYKPDFETYVIADGSPVGLGAVLVQKNDTGQFKIIHYALKTLTATEKKYAQTEREALALVWGCKKFYYYLYGKSQRRRVASLSTCALLN